MALRILAVCTGNICRSPIVEQLLRERLPALEFDVTSAGTQAVPGAPMTESALEMARRLELRYAQEHRAAQVTAGEIRRADLVLGLDRGHRRQVVEMVPAASRRTVTLREFAEIISALPERTSSANNMVDQRSFADALGHVLRHRGLQPRPVDPRVLDVVDPYGRGFSVYQRSTDTIAEAVDTIADYFNDAVDLDG